MKRFKSKKLNDTEVKAQYNIKIVTALYLQKTWVTMWTSMGLGLVHIEYHNLSRRFMLL
jgi:hypothetical protein